MASTDLTNTQYSIVVQEVATLEGLEPEKGALILLNSTLYMGTGTSFVAVGGGGGSTQNAILLES